MGAHLHIGFSGTQLGMTLDQRTALRVMLRAFKQNGAIYFHHGDCIGADEEAHSEAVQLDYLVIVHPPIVSSKRAFVTNYYAIRNKAPYLQRNKEIVNECTVLIATPKENSEVLRSGTWSTVRYALAEKSIVHVLLPGEER